MNFSCKKHWVLLPLAILCYVASAASPLATFNYKIFYTPDYSPIVETYFDIAGNSVVLNKNDDGELSAKVELTILFSQNNEIVTYEKKVLNSPVMTPENIVDFLDVQRFKISPGKYTVEIQLKDLLDPQGIASKDVLNINVPKPQSGAFFSDIEMVSAYKKTVEPDNFSKSGYDLLPMVDDDHLNAEMKEVIVYSELYGAVSDSLGGMLLMKSYIENTEANTLVKGTTQFTRRKTAKVIPYIERIPIEGLASGSYTIVIEARSKNNNLLSSQKISVYRSAPVEPTDVSEITEADIAGSWVNQYKSKVVLYEHFNSLRPITTESERTAMDNTFSSIEKVDFEYLKRYFYAFWKLRDENNSEKAWLEYKHQVDIAQQKFGTQNKRGYETDRGRVFLEYGPPNDISDRANEPSSYPYQIWRYYKAKQFNNVKFVFYDPTLMAQDYQLLHCEYIPGERQNPQWKVMLEKRNTPLRSIDQTEGSDHFGGRIDDFYNNPR